MKSILTILLTIGLLTIGSAKADDGFSAEKWIRSCNSKSKELLTLCNYYAFGVGGGLRVWSVTQAETASVCVPFEVSAGQLVAVGQKYYREHPKDRHYGAHVFLALAFKDAWPCG